MDKKSKEALRRYKKSRQAQSSSDSSSSDSDSGSGSSYSSTDSGAERKAAERHRKKKARVAAALAAGGSRAVRSSSASSADERRKREKREHCQKKLEAKRNHLKRKLKEAKLKKRAAAAAAAALTGHSHRALSPATQAKLKKKLAERKHQRAASKERREREKHRAAAVRERERDHHRVSRSPTKITKIRIHQDVGIGGKRTPSQKSPPPTRPHHPLMSRGEKIIIQTRTRDRTPSAERERMRMCAASSSSSLGGIDKLAALRQHDELARERERRERDRERAEREAARDKERAEALARCQERQRERERIAREKRRDEEEKKYGGGGGGGGGVGVGVGPDRLLPRPADREIAIAAARGSYNSRERSLEAVGGVVVDRAPLPLSRHGHHVSKRDAALDAYERERDYLEAAERRHGLLRHPHDARDELRREREREYLVAAAHRRRELSPAAAAAEHYAARMRGADPRDLYEEEERERAYNRAYLEDARGHPRERDPAGWLDPRDLRERELHDLRGGDPRELRDLREHELLYPEERERLVRERERERTLAGRGDWKNDWVEERHRGGGGGSERGDWEEPLSVAPLPIERGAPRGGFVGGPKRGGIGGGGTTQSLAREKRAPSEPDWDADEEKDGGSSSVGKDDKPGFSGASETPLQPLQREKWAAHHDQRGGLVDLPPLREKPLGSSLGGRLEHNERRWPTRDTGAADWRDSDEAPPARSGVLPHHHHRSERGGRGGGNSFRRGSGLDAHGGERGGFRPSHPPSLMTLPVAPPGGPLYGGGSPRFPNKRNMTYTNPNLIKKQQAALAAAKAAAQASAVAAATTAVAAAKAAAQSTANATTSAGILGRPPQPYASDSPEAGEIVSPEKQILDAAAAAIAGGGNGNSGAGAGGAVLDVKDNGELSEISDSDDDILNKTDKKPVKADSADDDTSSSSTKGTTGAAANSGAGGGGDAMRNSGQDTPTADDPKADDDEMLDFEEISDGELEEDARNKGVGDALGVDWASLIAETKRQAAETDTPSAGAQPTTAKQKWQPHRILLDIGVSMRMAGEEYAKRLLSESQQKLDAELMQSQSSALEIKTEIKEEVASNGDEDSQSAKNTNDEKKPAAAAVTGAEPAVNVDGLHPIACIQVAQRLRTFERQKLIANACGANSRALSARQDLKLRRQLCGLPARACDFPRPIPAVSEKLKAMALAAFQRTLEVK